MQPSNKTILERSIGRPAMMSFLPLTCIYLTTGQLIPGVV
nr:high light inducible protein [Prochlorococcus marinus]